MSEKFTVVNRSTVVGAVPGIIPDSHSTTFQTQRWALSTYARGVDAARNMRDAPSNRTDRFKVNQARVLTTAMVLSDAFGMAPSYWEYAMLKTGRYMAALHQQRRAPEFANLKELAIQMSNDPQVV